MQKGFTPILLLIGVLVVAAVAVGTYYLGKFSSKNSYTPPITQLPSPTNTSYSTPSPSSSSDETANWKIYTNNKVGFSLKYPPRYIKPTVPGSERPIDVNGSEDNIAIEFSTSTSDYISLSVIPFSKSLNELKTYGGDVDAETMFLRNGPLIDGSESRWYVIKKDSINYKRYKVDFLGKGHGFTLEYDENHSEREVNQVLSTFKFTTPSEDILNKVNLPGPPLPEGSNKPTSTIPPQSTIEH